ncbi:MAG: hypothetical protein CL868_09305 [Cytophagaceae bacterium]|nr:hypothetical protein [Cytophagaceae bacterium]|tara:strand:- start:7220 stop:7864 length:645 start_codon:yes stop_codon:yes gene_type:complete
MKELELLKKDWKKQEVNLPRLDTSAIKNMVQSRSSSLTKWILIIAILEFLFWTVLGIITSNDDNFQKFKDLHIYELNIVLSVVQYTVTLGFIYFFFRNYKLISTQDSTRALMKNILRVRRTVNAYVVFNLVFIFVITCMVVAATLMYHPDFESFRHPTGEETANFWVVLAIMAGFIIVILAVFWGFYKLLYGILLRRLRLNYKELSKLEFKNQK